GHPGRERPAARRRGSESRGVPGGVTVPALVEMRQITKTFGPVAALNRVDFSVNADEVVGLVGDNGAGKSTLMKILTGVYQPDAGEIWLGGMRVHFNSPLDSRERGIEMVYQDLGLAANSRR